MEPNPIHRYLLVIKENNKRYMVDYVAAERNHPLGIYGGRVVRMEIRCDGERLVDYDHAWLVSPKDPNSRMILRKALERARN